MAIKATYGEARQAYAALAGMSREDLKVRLAVVLK